MNGDVEYRTNWRGVLAMLRRGSVIRDLSFAFTRLIAWSGLAALLLSSGLAQPPALPDKYDLPLGIGFEELAYPYPTAFLNLFVEGQDVRRSIMDVHSTTQANSRAAGLRHGKNFWGANWADTTKFRTERG